MIKTHTLAVVILFGALARGEDMLRKSESNAENSSVTQSSSASVHTKIELDHLETCKTDNQKKMAASALAWLQDFANWNLSEQASRMSADFLIWHSSLAGLATFYKLTNPDLHQKLPFGDSKIKCQNYVNTLAFLAAANDITKWKEEPRAVYCLNDHDLTIDLQFSGFQVARDSEGYIQYAVPYTAPATKLFSFNSEGKMKLQTVGLDSATSTAARAELQRIMAADPNRENILPKDEVSKGTFMTFASKFAQEFRLECR